MEVGGWKMEEDDDVGSLSLPSSASLGLYPRFRLRPDPLLDLGLFRANLAEQRHAIHPGHLEIGDHQIEAAFLEELRGGAAVGRLHAVVAVELERVAHEFADTGFVVGD